MTSADTLFVKASLMEGLLGSGPDAGARQPAEHMSTSSVPACCCRQAPAPPAAPVPPSGQLPPQLAPRQPTTSSAASVSGINYITSTAVTASPAGWLQPTATAGQLSTGVSLAAHPGVAMTEIPPLMKLSNLPASDGAAAQMLAAPVELGGGDRGAGYCEAVPEASIPSLSLPSAEQPAQLSAATHSSEPACAQSAAVCGAVGAARSTAQPPDLVPWWQHASCGVDAPAAVLPCCAGHMKCAAVPAASTTVSPLSPARSQEASCCVLRHGQSPAVTPTASMLGDFLPSTLGRSGKSDGLGHLDSTAAYMFPGSLSIGMLRYLESPRAHSKRLLG